MHKSKLTIMIVGVFILVLSITQTVISNRLSTSGILMSKIEQEINSYKTDNMRLAEKVFSFSSLTAIASKAAGLGFVEGKSQYVVTSLKTLAARQ